MSGIVPAPVRHGEATLRFLLSDMADALAHPATSEVVVNEPGRFGVEQDGFWTWHDAPALTFDRLLGIAVLSAYLGGKDVGHDNASCSATLPDGQRIKMVLSSGAAGGTVLLAIRRRALSFVPTLEWLAERDYYALLDPAVDWPAFFRCEVIERRRTVLVCGDIGASKTTKAEALVRAIPIAMRVVTVERSAEWLNLPHPNWAPLYFNDADPMDAVRRVQDAMQMRPDWLPFQELQGGEAHAFSRALKIGTPGITTVHAPSARRAFASVVSMIQQNEAGRGRPAAEIEAELRQYVGYVLHCSRFLPKHDGERTRYRLTQVLEVGQTPAEDRMVSEAAPDAPAVPPGPSGASPRPRRAKGPPRETAP